MGGRITHSMADYFVTHMKVIRRDVALISDTSNAWPPALIDMAAGDVLLAFDIRRYENNVLSLVEMAADQGAVVVLITYLWVSPAAEWSRYRFSAHVEVPSAWDSSLGLLLMSECLVAAMQERMWESVKARADDLEQAFDRSRLFRKFT